MRSGADCCAISWFETSHLLFKPGQFYVLAALGGCVLFVVLLTRYGLPVQQAAFASIGTTLLLRLLAIRFNWQTFAVTEWQQHLWIPWRRRHRPPDSTPKE